MERHLTTSTGATSTRNEGSTTAIGVIRAEAAFNRNTAFDSNKRAWPARREPHPGSESVSVWMHTLILTGELTHGSAHTLEVEIERLFKEGVTGITLDLRQLTLHRPDWGGGDRVPQPSLSTTGTQLCADSRAAVHPARLRAGGRDRLAALPRGRGRRPSTAPMRMTCRQDAYMKVDERPVC